MAGIRGVRNRGYKRNTRSAGSLPNKMRLGEARGSRHLQDVPALQDIRSTRHLQGFRKMQVERSTPDTGSVPEPRGAWNVADRIRGMTVAVTGASRGIGRETAAQLSALGANLVLGARDTAAVEALAAELTARHPGVRVLPLPLDVAEEASVRDFARTAAERFGRVDALVNNAGFGVFAGALELSADDFARMLDVNLKGAFLCSQAFGRLMASQGSGKMLNLVSIAGTTALPGCAGYSASKFGLLGLTKVLQAELRTKGVQVTAVIPGAVASSFWDSMEFTPNLDDMIPTETLAAHLVYLLGQPDGAYIDEITIMPPKGIL